MSNNFDTILDMFRPANAPDPLPSLLLRRFGTGMLMIYNMKVRCGQNYGL
jgi:hypothetical protein